MKITLPICENGVRIINKAKLAEEKAIIAKTQEQLQDMVNKLVDTGNKYGMEIKSTNHK